MDVTAIAFRDDMDAKVAALEAEAKTLIGKGNETLPTVCDAEKMRAIAAEKGQRGEDAGRHRAGP